MKITEKNRELVKAFARIMKDIGISQAAAEMITSILKNKTQMDALVEYTQETPKATENDILEKAQEIAKNKTKSQIV